jgi:hypothetical protein
VAAHSFEGFTYGNFETIAPEQEGRRGCPVSEFEKGKSWRWPHRHGLSLGAGRLFKQVVAQVREKVERTLPKKIDQPSPLSVSSSKRREVTGMHPHNANDAMATRKPTCLVDSDRWGRRGANAG